MPHNPEDKDAPPQNPAEEPRQPAASSQGGPDEDLEATADNPVLSESRAQDQGVIAPESASAGEQTDPMTGASDPEQAGLDDADPESRCAILTSRLAARDQTITRLKAEISQAAQFRQRLEHDISFRQAQLEALEDDLESARQTLQDVIQQGSIEELHATIAAQQDQVATLEHYIANRRDHWHELQDKLAANQTLLREMEGELLERVNQVEQLENRARQAEAKVAALDQRRLAESLARQEQERAERDRQAALEADVAEWQAHAESLRADLASQRDQSAGPERQEQLQELRDRLEQAEAERSAAEQQGTEDRATIEALRADIEHWKATEASGGAALHSAESKIATLAQALADQETELVESRQAASSAHAALRESEQAVAAAEADNAAVLERISELEIQLDAARETPVDLPQAETPADGSQSESPLDSQAIDDLQQELLRERACIDDMRAAEDALMQQMGELEFSRQEAQRLARDLRHQLQERDAELSVFRERLGRLSGLKESIRDLNSRMSAHVQPDGADDHDMDLNNGRLLVCLSKAQPIRYPIYKDALTIGRTPDNDIQLHTNFVSRHHAKLICDGADTYIEDLQSKNGVYVNALRVAKERLKDGDQVTIGRTQFCFRLKDPREEPSEAPRVDH